MKARLLAKLPVRSAIIALLAAAGGLGIAVSAGAQDNSSGPGATSGTATSGTGTTVSGGGHTTPGSSGTPRSERTHPQVSPSAGGPATSFELSFRLRETPGHQGAEETDYRVQVAPRQNQSSCWPPQPGPVTSGRRGEIVSISLQAPVSGWCTGRYRVTVFLERGPYCPPPQSGRPCPEFATQELDTGQTHFTIR